MIYEAVFIQIIAFFGRDIEDPGRLDLSCCIFCDELRMLA